MGIIAKQFIECIVAPSLTAIGHGQPNEIQLVAGTAAQESHLGDYVKQIGGPALGPFQMEAQTHQDIWKNYLIFNPDYARRILAACRIDYPRDLGSIDFDKQAQIMVYNLFYAAVMCRLKYIMIQDPIPLYNDINGQAAYWKKYYNTVSGAGVVEDYLTNFDRYLKPYYNKS